MIRNVLSCGARPRASWQPGIAPVYLSQGSKHLEPSHPEQPLGAQPDPQNHVLSMASLVQAASAALQRPDIAVQGGRVLKGVPNGALRKPHHNQTRVS